jgi:hypothetical protein
MSGPSPEVVALVWERDGGRCAVCAATCTGERGFDWSVQHRLRRGAGGTRRPWVNLPGNLILMHGHGTSLCHGDVERQRQWARDHGYRVVDGVVRPADVPVSHAVHGLVLLDDEGGWTRWGP